MSSTLRRALARNFIKSDDIFVSFNNLDLFTFKIVFRYFSDQNSLMYNLPEFSH